MSGEQLFGSVGVAVDLDCNGAQCVHVAGYVYDVQDGHLREVVASTALREPTLR